MDDINRKQKELQEFWEKISKYKAPEELFGEMAGQTVAEQLIAAKGIYRKLALEFNADKFDRLDSGAFDYLTKEIMTKINYLYEEAKKKIENGTYGKADDFSDGDAVAVINVGKRIYKICDLEMRTDFAEIFRGLDESDDDSEPVCIKMAKVTDEDNFLLGKKAIKNNNDLVAREITVLKELDAIKDDAFQKVRQKHFPVLLDDFKYRAEPDGSDSDDPERVALVTKYFGGCDLVTLKESFANGIPLYHACWILERMLSGSGHLHYQGRLHGNIHPGGVFIRSRDHNVMLGDLEFSVNYIESGSKYLGATDIYTAPEVYQGAAPHPRADTYSIGMVMIYILNGDVLKGELPASFELVGYPINPDKKEKDRGQEGIRSLILSLANKHPLARSDDAWKAHRQLSNLRKWVFGKPAFTEFKIPGT